jgi:hypothetical protein
MGNSILLGNGVNLLIEGTPSWRSVIMDLARYVDKKNIISQHLDKKPFTLVFEEIFLRSSRTQNITELQLKKRAAELINQIPHNKFHTAFMDIGVRHILTTNYDYNLEESIQVMGVETSLSLERKYSLFRRRTAGSVNVWHIHGESKAPNSLMLGHEQYSGSLQKMRTYLTTGRSRSKRDWSPFRAGVMNFDKEEKGVYSWVDVFLRDDIHIIGLSLHYTEIDLWWLLIYKERLRLKGENIGKTFFYVLDPKPNPDNTAKNELLRSFGVIVVEKFRKNSYLEGYSTFLDDFTA